MAALLLALLLAALLIPAGAEEMPAEEEQPPRPGDVLVIYAEEADRRTARTIFPPSPRRCFSSGIRRISRKPRTPAR